MIKVCEARQAASFEQKLSQLRDEHTAQRERYRALLREHRDRLDALKLDDLLKVLVGMFGGFLIRAFSEKGLGAFSDTWVGFSVFLLAVSLSFLIVRAVRPSNRRREIDAELRELDEKKP